MTRQEIQEQWPTDYAQPAQATLWRLLDRAVQQRLLCQDGTGKKRDPFRFWLPGREDMLRPEPGASPEEMQAWNQRIMKEFWAGRGRKARKRRKGEVVSELLTGRQG